MRICLETSTFRVRMAGVAYYAWFLSDQLVRHYPGISLTGFDGTRFEQLDEKKLADVLTADRQASPAKSLYQHARKAPVARAAYRKLKEWRFVRNASRFDVYHAINSMPPTDIDRPVLPLVHDVSHERMPEVHPEERVVWLRKRLRNLGRYRLINTVSHFSAREIADCYGVPLDRIRVTYPGVNPRFRRPAEDEALKRLGGLGLQTGKFFLTVGTIEPRKNFDVLIDAYADLPPSLRQSHPLVLVGQPGWGKLASRHADMLRQEGSVRFTGYVDEALLRALYASATAMLFPTLYEGFGIPVAEALAAGLPVIASDIAIMHEVAGQVATFVPPRDVAAWTEAIRRLHDASAEDRLILAHASVEQSARFSWSANARDTAALYRELHDNA